MRHHHPGYGPEESGLRLRSVVELLVCLFVTVLCVRTFVIEGYMISTGSMAPGLLGYHKRVVCPTCNTNFQLGVAFEENVDSLVAPSADEPTRCSCPNCGEPNIDVSWVPKTQGDQLLVHKNAYLWRQPDRWEVVVFRNPALATEAYVKRMIGLPGERIRILDGDIFVNGVRAQKNLGQSRATELVVYDDETRPRNVDWRSRWSTGKSWTQMDRGFASKRSTDWSWIYYEHWLRTGGGHKTSVAIDKVQLDAARRKWAIDDGFPFHRSRRIQFDMEAGRLSVRGVLDPDLRDRLRAASSDAAFRASVDELAERSHFAPVQDTYGYNARQKHFPVRDLGVELKLTSDLREGEFVARLNTPTDTFELVLNLSSGEVKLFGHAGETTLRTGTFAPSALSQGALLGFRHVDQRVLVSLDDELLLEPLNLPGVGSGDPLNHKPVAFATRNGDLKVSNIRIVRDIHYTPGQARNGVTEEFVLGDEEYYVLGDNSPVSSDSRNWNNGAVNRRDLIGKPIVVHLPSSPKALRFGGANYLIRIPEFSKIRYIR